MADIIAASTPGCPQVDNTRRPDVTTHPIAPLETSPAKRVKMNEENVRLRTDLTSTPLIVVGMVTSRSAHRECGVDSGDSSRGLRRTWFWRICTDQRGNMHRDRHDGLGVVPERDRMPFPVATSVPPIRSVVHCGQPLVTANRAVLAHSPW